MIVDDKDDFHIITHLDYVHPNGAMNGIDAGAYRFDKDGNLLSKRMPDNTVVEFQPELVKTAGIRMA
jgi:hypothetical protein